MNAYLVYLLYYLAGGATVGAWWWYIGHRARAKALLQNVEQKLK